MANNRMFLIHRPTRLGVMLGKRMGWGWYQAPLQVELQRFYTYLENHPKGEQDDFILAQEDCEHAPGCFGDWDYTYEQRNGFRVFKLRSGTLHPDTD